VDRAGRIAAYLGFGLTTVNAAGAAIEATADRPIAAVLLTSIGAVALGLGSHFYRESSVTITATAAMPLPQPPGEYMWGEGIGWVPQELYDPEGPL